jgi:hypothetical protein
MRMRTPPPPPPAGLWMQLTLDYRSSKLQREEGQLGAVAAQGLAGGKRGFAARAGVLMPAELRHTLLTFFDRVVALRPWFYFYFVFFFSFSLLLSPTVGLSLFLAPRSVPLRIWLICATCRPPRTPQGLRRPTSAKSWTSCPCFLSIETFVGVCSFVR